MGNELLYLRAVNGLSERMLYGIFSSARQHRDLAAALPPLFDKEVEDRCRGQLAVMERSGIVAFSILDDDYPAPLRRIDSPPPVLFRRGAYLPADDCAIAVVGSRAASDTGKRLTERLVAGLKGLPVTIVSGLAAGIDSTAHKAALDTGLRTIAVTGCGLDIAYPATNRNLADAIARSGCLFSEHPPGTPPLPHHFPRRNRIISGLARCVVVAEAGERSGSLITARLAASQGRDVFAFPRTPTERNAAGTNSLLKIGAKILTSADDLLADQFPGLQPAPRPAPPALSPEESRIFNILCDEPLHVDELCNKLDMGPATLANFLLRLEFKDVVRELPGKYYVRT